MTPRWNALLRALAEPAAMAGFDASSWSLVLRQASHAGLLGRLGALAQRAGVQEQIPRAVWHQMEAVLSIADQQRRAVRWELVHLSANLAELKGPVLLLKGAAYAAAGLAPAAGRLFGDIDILVPKSQLDGAEAALMLGGWVSNHQSDYDLRYYRQWMHELPPMRHIKRQTELDLHHNILPESARTQTRPAPILASATALSEFPRFSIPAPIDQILHSATHLFHEGEWEHGLRDLSDLDLLLRAYGQEHGGGNGNAPSDGDGGSGGFWAALLGRAAELNLGRPLFYALSLCRRVLATPVPAEVIKACPARPGPLMRGWMTALFLQALSSAHAPSSSRFAGPAAFALYLRSHYLRMPWHLLLPHLLAKAWQRVGQGRKAARERAADAQP